MLCLVCEARVGRSFPDVFLCSLVSFILIRVSRLCSLLEEHVQVVTQVVRQRPLRLALWTLLQFWLQQRWGEASFGGSDS